MLRQHSVSGHQLVDKWVVDTVTWSVWSVCVLSAAVDRLTSFTSWLTAVFCLTCLSVGSSRFCKWLCWSPLLHSEHSCQQFSTSVCITFVQSWPRSVLTTASCVCMCVSEWVSELRLMYPSTYYRSFKRRDFPVNHLCWYWHPNKNNQETEHINNIIITQPKKSP